MKQVLHHLSVSWFPSFNIYVNYTHYIWKHGLDTLLLHNGQNRGGAAHVGS